MGMEGKVKVKKRRRQSDQTKYKLYKAIFIIVLIWFLGSGVIKFARALFIDTEIARVGMIEEVFSLNAYLIRDEIIINAPATGQITRKVQSGSRIGKDKEIFQVQTASGSSLENLKLVSALAPEAGVVSYALDGLEQFFQPNMFGELDLKKIEARVPQYIDNSKLEIIEKGSSFCKIVNNLDGIQLYLEFPLDLFQEPLQVGRQLRLKFPQLTKEILAPIIDLKGFGEQAQVLVKISELWYSLINQRMIQVELVLDRQEGVLIPIKALSEKENGEVGLFWLRKGFVFWREIEVVARDGNQIIVKGLEPLTEIILTPGLVKEGQYIGGNPFGYRF